MPKLISLYIRSCLIGFALAGVFVALLLWLNVAGLGALILGSPEAWIAVAMLWVANGVVFAGVQFGYAVMAMAER
ncbi:hypothetical protein [Histidinibacterium aquaticum]|uniref:Uncharacterized protein n=1 Tax=Histidinibacterium aquaticum TaxID=2613962 RepID=A0A5J5GIF8_9RHOB|nr:hypothetical protein [Histidinibacterium aquaticum]KAA9008016.1 hypothetical protein F3S47_10925 [Histidinibacterium aquaticum]